MALRVGIIGTGFAARAHADALRRIPDVELVAVASRDAQRAHEFARAYRLSEAHVDYLALVQADQVDAVHVCTENDIHAQLATAALAARKHVLCEKPLGVDASQTRALTHAAAEAAEDGIVSGVCFNYRFFPLVREIRERLVQSSNGPPHLVHGRYLQDWLLNPTDWNWRVDPVVGGASRAMADIGSHWCDLAQFVLQQRVTRVFADLGVLHESRWRPAAASPTFSSPRHNGHSPVAVSTEDFGSLLLRFENGTKGSLVVSQVSAGRKNNLVIQIETGETSYAWDQENPDRLWVGSRRGPNLEVVRDPDALSGAAAALSHYPPGHVQGWPDGLWNMIAAFYSAAGAGRPDRAANSGVASFAEAHRQVQLVEAAALSSRVQQWIDVDELAPVNA